MSGYSKHNMWVGVSLAIVLGAVGAHRSYMGKYGICLLYGMFAWTGVPFLMGVIEAFLMPRRVDRANQAGKLVEWKKAILFPVIGFVLMYPTAILVMTPLAYWLGEDVSANEGSANSVVNELDRIIDGNSKFATVFEGDELEVAERLKDLLIFGEVAYQEQALPFLRAVLPYDEFSARYMVLFENENMHLHSAGPMSIPALHQERALLVQAELTKDEDAIRRWRPIVSVVDKFMEHVEGREFVVGCKPHDWKPLRTLNFTYVNYDGDYRLARVYLWDDPLEWEDIYEHLRQSGGTEGQAEALDEQ